MRVLLLGTGILLGACGDPVLSETGEPAPPCTPAPTWAEGQVAFLEQTSGWGLTGVVGVRLVAVDFDGDGWTDLAVHRGGDSVEDFEGARRSWLLRNDQGQGFVDVTQSSGFRTMRGTDDPSQGRPGSIVSFGDIDNDGDLDGLTAVADPDGTIDETSELLLNQGDGTFTLGDVSSALRVDSDWVPAGATFVDTDRDGHLDLWIPQNSVGGVPQQDRLFVGDGEGGFSDVTGAVGLTTKAWSSVSDLNTARSHTNAWSSLACDLDGDGWPELLAGSYGRAPNHLWRNEGDGSFVNASIESGYAFDENQDWTDNEFARCHCKLHPSDEGCEGLPDPAIRCNSDDDVLVWRHAYDRNPFRLGGNSAETTCVDIDNDGDMDLVTGEIVHWWAGANSDSAELLLNDGSGVFTRPGRDASGLDREYDRVDWNDGDMTNAVFDFDNDGWPDIYIGNSDYPGARGLLYHQRAPGLFEPVPLGDGIDHLRSHGAAVADFDRDGDLDIVVGHSRQRCGGSYEGDCYETQQIRFFENQLDGSWLQLALEGRNGSNRSAIGAVVTVTAGGVSQTQQVGGGGGHYGAQDDLVLHFGLGASCEANVVVQWPDASGTRESFTVPAGQRLLVVQGETVSSI